VLFQIHGAELGISNIYFQNLSCIYEFSFTSSRSINKTRTNYIFHYEYSNTSVGIEYFQVQEKCVVTLSVIDAASKCDLSTAAAAAAAQKDLPFHHRRC
jgi:hypothetical protein